MVDFTLLQKHTRIVAYTLKDQSCLYYLQQMNETVQVVEYDLDTGTVRRSCQCLTFDDVSASDSHYQIGVSQTIGAVIVVFPNMAMCIYSDDLTLKSVYKSRSLLQYVVVLNDCLVAVAESTHVIHVPLDSIELLASRPLQKLISSKTSERLYVLPVPQLLESAKPVDLVVCGASRLLLPFNDGSIWEVDFDDQDNQSIVGIKYMHDFIGSEVSPKQVNTVDLMYVNQKSGRRATSFAAKVSEYLIFGDIRGSLAVLKDKRPQFFDLNFSAHQIASLRWLSANLQFAVLTTDGLLKLCQLSPIRPSKSSTKGQPNCFKVSKLGSIQPFQELNRQLDISALGLRGFGLLAKCEEMNACQTLQIHWPTKLMKKFIKKVPEEFKLVTQCELKTVRITNTLLPMFSRAGQGEQPLVIQSVTVPRQFKDFVPSPEATHEGVPSLVAEAKCFFVEADPATSHVWINEYDFASEQVTQLVNITKDSGVYEDDFFQVVNLDIRPVCLASAPTARFVVSLEMQQSAEPGLVCSFQMEMATKRLDQHVIQLPGKYGIYLGKLDYADPSILILNQDLKSVMVFSLDQGDLDSKLPRGDVKLQSKVVGLFWSPIRDGLAVLYEMEQDNILTFSKNRIEKNNIGDFDILLNRKYSLKLTYDERVLDVKWTGFSADFASSSDRQLKGVVATNQRIYIVDDKLAVQSMIKQVDSLTSIRWLGDQTVLATTKSHLFYMTCGKNPITGAIMSFSNSNENHYSLIAALSDRVILSTQKSSERARFEVKSLFMLEALLLGYLNSVSSYRLDLSLISSCMKYLDTNAISGQLARKMTSLRLFAHLNLLGRNQPGHAAQTATTDTELDCLFPYYDLSKPSSRLDLITKLALDPACCKERLIVRQRAENQLTLGNYYEAYNCAELLGDLELAVIVLQKANISQEAFQSFLQVAANTKTRGWASFDPKLHLPMPAKKKQVEETIPKLVLGFDEVPFVYCVTKNEKQQMLKLASGHSFKPQEQDNHLFQSDDFAAETPQDFQTSMQIEDDEEGQPDEVDEERFLLAYWRCEEASTDKVLDIGSNGLHLTASELVWEAEKNADNDPVAYEDKWGKVAEPNFSFTVPSALVFTKPHPALLCFTLEAWLKFSGRFDKLTLIQTEHFAINLYVDIISFSEQSQSPQIKPISPLSGWMHIALSFSRQDLSISLHAKTGETSEVQFISATQLKLEIGPATRLLGCERPGLLATELRLWKKALTQLQLKGVRSQPLAILYDRKRQLNILINKKKTTELADKPKKKVGGLKMTSKFDQKKKDNETKPINETINQLEVVEATEKPVIEARPNHSHQEIQFQFEAQEPELQVSYGLPEAQFKFEVNDQMNDFEDFGSQSVKPDILSFDFRPQTGQPFDAFDFPVQTDISIDNEQYFTAVEYQTESLRDPFSFQLTQNQPSQPSFSAFEFAVEQPSTQTFEFSAKPMTTQNFEFTPASSFDFVMSPTEAEPFSFPLVQSQNQQTTDLINGQCSATEFNFDQVQQTSEQSSSFQFGEIVLFCQRGNCWSWMSRRRRPGISRPSRGVTGALLASECDCDCQVRSSSAVFAVCAGASVAQTTRTLPFGLCVPSNKLSEVTWIGLVPSSRPYVLCFGEIVDDQSYVASQCCLLCSRNTDQLWNLTASQSVVEKSIEDLIIESQIDKADAKIAEELNITRAEAQHVKSPEGIKAAKQKIRDLVLMKFTCDLASQIGLIKLKLQNPDQTQFQQTNLISRMASFANVLILLKLPDRMKPAFFKFAIKQNLKVKNYAAVQKIVSFWMKSLGPEQEQFIGKAKEYEALCAKNNNVNHCQYHGFDCPACGANLTFGLATPQCTKCKAKLGICYDTLTSILKTDCLKCHVCLAEFDKREESKLCPICKLVQLKQNQQ